MSSVPPGAPNAAGLSLPSVAAAAAAAVANAAAAANASAAGQSALPSAALSAAAAAAVAAATNAASNANPADGKSKQLNQNMNFNVPQLPTVGNAGGSASSVATAAPSQLSSFPNLNPSPFLSAPLYPANYAASVQSMIGNLQPRPGNSLTTPLMYADSNPLANYNALMMKQKYKKKINLACHFCDHAARRPGRQKTAMLVSCSSPHCRKVFCSRPACYKKLPIGLRINTWEGFVEWKRQLELGLAVFVCPHCVDESHCPGPQCQKRWQKRLNRGTGGKGPAAGSPLGSSGDNENKDNNQALQHNSGLGLSDSLNVLPQLSAMLSSGIPSSSILGGFGASMPSGLAAAAAAAVAAGAASGNANAAAAHAAMNAVMSDASLAAAASAASKAAAAQPGSATANALNAVAAASAAAAAAKNAAGAPSSLFPGAVDFSAAANAVLSASLNSATLPTGASRGQKSATQAPSSSSSTVPPPTYSQLMSIQQQVGLSQLSSLTGARNAGSNAHDDANKK